MRYLPKQDEYGRWAVQDTAQPRLYLFISRYADEDSAQAMCDVQNAAEAGQWQKMRTAWKVYDRVVRYAPMIERSRS